MRFGKKSLAALAAATMVVAPISAHAATNAAKHSVTKKVERVGSAKDESKLGGGSGMIVAALAAVAVIVGIILIADDGSDSPG